MPNYRPSFKDAVLSTYLELGDTKNYK